jgi:hypothetical protein
VLTPHQLTQIISRPTTELVLRFGSVQRIAGSAASLAQIALGASSCEIDETTRT